MEITVPTIVCQGCIDNLMSAIKAEDTNAVIAGDLATKKLTITSTKTLGELIAIITATGHQTAS